MTPLAHAIEEIRLHGVRLHRLTMDQAVATVAEFLQAGGAHHVVTADTSAVVMAATTAAEIIERAAYAGRFGVAERGVWGTRCGARHRVDLMARLCAHCATSGITSTSGAAPGVAGRQPSACAPVSPACGGHHGYFQPRKGIIAGSRLRRRRAFVAFGIPRQESGSPATWSVWECVAIGVGAAWMSSRAVQRAPRWVQRANLEWLDRLLRNPRKISKVKTLPVLVWLTLAAMLRGTEGARHRGR